MRSLVYVAGAYAMCMGAAEAFAPQTTVPSGTFAKAKECSAGERTAPLNAWQPYGGYVPKNRRPPAAEPAADGMARAYTPAASAPAPAAPAKSWQPYGGYDPKNRGAPAPAPAADTAVMA